MPEESVASSNVVHKVLYKYIFLPAGFTFQHNSTVVFYLLHWVSYTVLILTVTLWSVWLNLVVPSFLDLTSYFMAHMTFCSFGQITVFMNQRVTWFFGAQQRKSSGGESGNWKSLVVYLFFLSSCWWTWMSHWLKNKLSSHVCHVRFIVFKKDLKNLSVQNFESQIGHACKNLVASHSRLFLRVMWVCVYHKWWIMD